MRPPRLVSPPERPRIGRRSLLALAAASGLGLPAARASGPVIRHAMAAAADGRPGYRLELLHLVLEKSRPRYGDFELQFTGAVPQARAFTDLETGRLDLSAAMTDNDREQRAIPVRYCLYRGLLGLRVGLGLPDTVRRLEAVDSEQALRSVSLGLVQDWPDFAIQRAAGLQVVRLTNLKSGVLRLRLGSFDLLPMGAVEAEEVAEQYGLNLVSRWAMAYPTAFYFFTAPQQPMLAERLAHGFEVALRDGSFDALFARHVEPALTAMHVARRQIFRLPNPLLPAATPLGRSELWHPLMGRMQPKA